MKENTAPLQNIPNNSSASQFSSAGHSNESAGNNHINRELYRVKASRLVDFFPDELVVQEKTICVIRNHFLVSFTETIPVKDIGRVVYIDIPFFASIQIIGKNTAHELDIKGLYKDKAAHAKEVIEGLLLEDRGVVDIPEWIEAEARRKMLANASQELDGPEPAE